jgi:ketosteroid isomerase-like protein
MVDRSWALAFAKEWIESWNSNDLERIFRHYTDDFEMSSPLIIERAYEPGGTLKGKENIRAYWQKGLAQTPRLHFRFQRVLVGAKGLTILYTNQRNQQVAEVLVFNDSGKAISGSAY